MNATSLRAPARSSVEEPSFEIPEEDWYAAELVGWTEPQVSQYPSRLPEKKGEYPMVLALRYELDFEKADGSAYEIRTRLFDPDDPHDKTQVENQKALAGREVDEDDGFDYGDYVGKQVRILVVHVDKEKNGKTLTYANIGKVSAAKKKPANNRPKAEDFPEE